MTSKIKIFAILLLFSFFACTNEPKQKSTKKTEEKQTIIVPVFNADSAYKYVEKQVNFGARVPNTEAHKKCGNYLTQTMKKFGAEVIEQEATVLAYDGTPLKMKNIIAQYNKDNPNRILLCSHWDSRPFADHDSDESKRNNPILGANDGASGVGVLMEIARQLQKQQPYIGIDIIFFDAEDYGEPDHIEIKKKQDTWCLGSQYWSKNQHVRDYQPRFGVLLDMVGVKGASFTKEGVSLHFASDVLDKVWKTAEDLGYSNYFSYEETQPITDDHYYINQLANIPTIDIIHYEHSTESHFGTFWHTHKDDMSSIDKTTLKAVGQTLLEVIFRED